VKQPFGGGVFAKSGGPRDRTWRKMRRNRRDLDESEHGRGQQWPEHRPLDTYELPDYREESIGKSTKITKKMNLAFVYIPSELPYCIPSM